MAAVRPRAELTHHEFPLATVRHAPGIHCPRDKVRDFVRDGLRDEGFHVVSQQRGGEVEFALVKVGIARNPSLVLIRDLWQRKGAIENGLCAKVGFENLSLDALDKRRAKGGFCHGVE